MKTRTTRIVVAIGALIVIGAVLIYMQFVRPYIEDTSLPPCAELPYEQDVEEALTRHKDTVERIKALERGGSVMIFPYNPDDCPNKSALMITYGGKETRDAIRRQLGDTFFGIPYRMANV